MTDCSDQPHEESRGDQYARVIDDVRAAEMARKDALISADPARMEAVLADDLIHVHSTGMVHDKEAFIAHVSRMGGFISIEREDFEIHLCGDLAITTGPTINRVRSPKTGEEVALEGFQTVIFRRNERQSWQVLLSQLTPLRNSH